MKLIEIWKRRKILSLQFTFGMKISSKFVCQRIYIKITRITLPRCLDIIDMQNAGITREDASVEGSEEGVYRSNSNKLGRF